MIRRVLLGLGLVAICAGAAACPSAAMAQGRERVFLRLSGDETVATHARALSMLFEGPLLKRGGLELAGTVEMEEVFAECRAEIGVSAVEERRCRLQAARRLTVVQVIELELATRDDGRVRAAMSVWDASSGGKVYGGLVEAGGDGLDVGLGEVLPRLASEFLCFRGVAADCPQPNGDAGISGTLVDGALGAGRGAGAKQPEQTGDAHSQRARQVTFLPHEDGVWTLHRAGGVPECTLPCTRWVEPESGLYVAATGDDGLALSRIDVPADLGYGPELALEAAPELASDWQTWETASLSMLGGSVALIAAGIAVMTVGDGELATWQKVTGATALSVGSFTLGFVLPVYALVNWSSGDVETLQFQPAPAAPTAAVTGLQVGWTF